MPLSTVWVWTTNPLSSRAAVALSVAAERSGKSAMRTHAGFSLHQREQADLRTGDGPDGIALPVADVPARLHDGRTLFDHHALVDAFALQSAKCFAPGHARQQRAPRFLFRCADLPVDRAGRTGRRLLPRDELRRPSDAQPLFNGRSDVHIGQLACAARPLPTLKRQPSGATCVIEPVLPRVAPHLTSGRRVRASQQQPEVCPTRALAPFQFNVFAFRQAKVRIRMSHVFFSVSFVSQHDVDPWASSFALERAICPLEKTAAQSSNHPGFRS